jgi:hypothetical protein
MTISTSNRIRNPEVRKNLWAKAILIFFCGCLVPGCRSPLPDQGEGRGEGLEDFRGLVAAVPTPHLDPLPFAQGRGERSQVCWLSLGMPFDQDHVGLGCAVAHFARFAVLLAIQPLFGALR